MANDLAEYLQSHGPQLSGPVAAGLATTLGISAAAARKRIERLEPPVRALDLQFPRGAQFLYVESQYAGPLFWRALADAVLGTNGAYARAIWALAARGGVVPLAHFAAAAGCSSGQRQLAGDAVFGRLVSAGLLQELEIPGLGTCAALKKSEFYVDESLPAIRGRLVAETVLLQSAQEWAAKLGLGSFHSFKLRSDAPGGAPAIGTFAWDLTAPSYLAPLATWSGDDGPKPGFLAIDVLLTEVVGADDVQPFLHKCASLRQQRRIGRCLQIFVANRYSKDALNLIRRAGIVPATPEALFGTEVARALLELIRTLSQVAEQVVDPRQFAELFERLGKAEAAAGTLRGALFEFVVADLVRQLTPGVAIVMNKLYREGGKDVAEVDVRALVANRQIRFIECKGLLPGHRLSDDEVDKWLTRRIPIVRAHTKRNPELQNLKLSFELWVTGELSQDSKQKIAEARQAAARKGDAIEVVLADDLEALVDETKDPSLKKVVDQHFLKAPLALPVDVINPMSKRRIPQNPFEVADEAAEGRTAGAAE